MNIIEYIKSKFQRRSDDMPDLPDYKKKIDSIFDPVIRMRQEEYYIWLLGESDRLVNFYLDARKERESGSSQTEFRNSRDYFWAIASKEADVKRTHSSLPGAIVYTLNHILGKPSFSIQKANEEGKLEEDKDNQERLADILKACKFYATLKRKQVPLMLGIGDGVWTVLYNSSISKRPIIEFIDGKNCSFEWFGDICTAVNIRKFYTDSADKNYMLIERRSTNEGKATIQYALYLLDNDLKPKELVNLDRLPETRSLKDTEFPYIDRILAVPCIFKFDHETERGKSIFAGKLDLFDDLDQNLSQASNTVRLSTPEEYYPEALSDRTADGKTKPPKRYDRRFITVPNDFDAVGENNNKIFVTQPQLNFDKYDTNALEIVHNILSGLMSPATLGIDLARKDNATAQREKEKVTFSTRDDLVDCETEILSELFNLILKVDDYIHNKPSGEYDININYPEYGSPTFDDKLNTLTPALSQGAISPERFVDELWEDSLTEDEKIAEIEYLKSQRPGMAPMEEDESDKGGIDFSKDDKEDQSQEEGKNDE
jgi:hypothetical protein